MLSIRQLLASHAPVLAVDAASSTIQVGWLDSISSMEWTSSAEESGTGVFHCLETLNRPTEEARAFLFCDGPGSVLGIRTVAMALRTWRMLSPFPIYAFHSLALVAHVHRTHAAKVIVDARRDAWHCVDGTSEPRRVPTSELVGELITPEGFRNWTPLPSGVKRVPYSLRDLFPLSLDAELLRTAEEPDAFLHEGPSYAKWTPRIHRAP